MTAEAKTTSKAKTALTEDPNRFNVRESFMAAAIEADDIGERLCSLGASFLEAANLINDAPQLQASAYDSMLEFRDKNRKPEPSPPEGFTEDLLRFVAEIEDRCWCFMRRLDEISSDESMDTLSGLIDHLDMLASQFLLCFIFTCHGQPTPIELANYLSLNREPVTVRYGLTTYSTVKTPRKKEAPEDRDLHRWEAKVTRS